MLETFYDAPAGEEATAANKELLDELAAVFDADVTLKNLDGKIANFYSCIAADVGSVLRLPLVL